MKNRFGKLCVFMLLFFKITILNAQEEKFLNYHASADFVSRYVWRGTDFGNAPAIQPSMNFSLKSFTIGAWGNYSLSSNTGGMELDLYAGYDFDFGLNLTFTDYYFPGEVQMADTLGIISSQRKGSYFDYDNSHTFEFAISQEIKGFQFMLAYYLNQDDDIYLEAGYSFNDNISFFIGAGNKSYTNEELANKTPELDGSYSDEFMLVNLGISVQKDLEITDKFSLPVGSTIIINPYTEQVFLVFNISI